ncbi:hypothetical protein Bbelb_260310 [Branchiostoma belcheri]|nr:hypothetical protein Bbelb_260310 [Branchiostoma belcheri]
MAASQRGFFFCADGACGLPWRVRDSNPGLWHTPALYQLSQPTLNRPPGRSGGGTQSPIVKNLPADLAESGGEELQHPRRKLREVHTPVPLGSLQFRIRSGELENVMSQPRTCVQLFACDDLTPNTRQTTTCDSTGFCRVTVNRDKCQRVSDAALRGVTPIHPRRALTHRSLLSSSDNPSLNDRTFSTTRPQTCNLSALRRS